MFSIILSWKAFNVNLELVESWIKTNTTGCTGTSADDCLTCWFTEEQNSDTRQRVRDYWDALDESSNEATSYVSSSDIKAALQAAREDAVTKTWDNLSVAQKKLIAGLTPTNAELGL